MKDNILTIIVASALSGAALLTAQAAWAVDERFSLSTGFDYSSGNYGTASTTDILSIPVIGKYATGHWVFKLSAPYVRISGTGAVIPGTGVVGAGGTTGTTQSGLGDTVAAATYNIYENTASNLAVDLTGKVKLATASAGIGTGANDYAAQADVYQSVDKFTAMGTLGSKVLGSTNGITLNNVLYGSFGGAYQFAKQASGGVDMSSSQSYSATGAGQRELTAYVNYKIDKSLKIQGYVLKGLSNGSPDHGVGALISSKF